MLFAYDVSSSPDRVWLQNPANAGTLLTPKPLGVDLGLDLGFDVAGADNVGYVAGTPQGQSGAQLYAVDVTSGDTRRLGRIGHGGMTITGLAAWQS
jgi:uncharacterized protein DUF4394